MPRKLKLMLKSYGRIKGSAFFARYCFITMVNVGVARFLRSILGIRNVIVLKGQTDFSGNCKALYDELIQNGFYEKYKIVWHINNDSNRYKLNDGYCEVISDRNWLKKIYYNATASIVFYEVSCCFQRRVKGQRVVYLGHGCPSLKNCKGFITLNPKLDTNAMITSDKVRDVMSDMLCFQRGKFIVNGMARNDVIPRSQMKFQEFGFDESMKVVIWMPTFRSSNIVENNIRRNDSTVQYLYGLPLIHSEADLRTINDVLHEKRIILLIKPHPRAAQCGIEELKFSNIIVWTNDYLEKHNIDMYSLFTSSSGLITDYSSVAFDYMLADRPMAYIIDDMKSYKLGFAYENITDYMPGDHIKDIVGLLSFFCEIFEGKDPYLEKRHQVCAWANQYNDGNNAKRLIEIFHL
ncbi:CDP-Glycerol:Poly(glycerophosphate) glycerophosphotransferase [[Eubacterium] contortum]|uniref:CDP-Glycerol:Poly(Glycerophosphate) glycerophosphotransferase n=1 Tax=Faecalicatena contorta TaxID=39482 RepID=A0A174F4N4_9FIRM|nr:CDP-glycerol glycerophosphotransferase family protein [Faecalicatena contorta]CUO45203.1 CDP-Glycerol:Poly(glycerophosphate) glycerophosphotransferase [[Eubacterium] contortum] [Faecalicatena contorta]